MVAVTSAIVVLLASAAGPVAAHLPTPQGSKLWSNGQAATYKWGVWTIGANQYTVPSWLRAVMTNDFETTWADPATNNSNGPRFTVTTATSNVVAYFAPDNPVHTTMGWLGSTDATLTPRKIWLRSDPTTAGYKPWCDLTLQTGCPDAGRAAIHEIGHAGGFLDHNTSSIWTDTRMQISTFPFNATSTWNTRTLGRCDEARLQMMYDVDSTGGSYGDCFDHVPNAGAGGMKTTLTSGPASTTACSGDTVTISGRLQIYAGGYGALDSNALTNRVISITRNGAAWSTAVATSASGNNWSKAISASVAVTTTYTYVAQFDRNANSTSLRSGLASSATTSFSITWLPSPPC